ncbi:MAG: hypothetical protein QXW19_01790 [Candidatus Bathyarchaeia archaeon]
MRRTIVLALIAVLVLSAILEPASAQGIQASLLAETELRSGLHIVRIKGRVITPQGMAVPNAAVSLQVKDPRGSTVHIALLFTGADGAYEDEFALRGEYASGNYTVYLLAEKIGFGEARAQLTFGIFKPDFRLSAHPTVLEVQQGGSSKVAISIEPLHGFDSLVELSLQGLPEGVSFRFSRNPAQPPSSVLLELICSANAPVGRYNITAMASGGGIVRAAALSLIVREAWWRAPGSALAALATFLALLGAYMALRRRRAKMARAGKPDLEYLAAARALARLEELKALGRITDSEYQRLKEEYERKLGRG